MPRVSCLSSSGPGPQGEVVRGAQGERILYTVTIFKWCAAEPGGSREVSQGILGGY